jgi:hypothetical protein
VVGAEPEDGAEGVVKVSEREEKGREGRGGEGRGAESTRLN